MSASDAVDFVKRLVGAWDCCATCAGGVLAAHDAEVRERERYEGWMPFGKCVDLDVPLEFSEPDEGGLPKWERISREQ